MRFLSLIGLVLLFCNAGFGQDSGVMRAFDPNNPFNTDQSVPKPLTLEQARLQERARLDQQNSQHMQQMGMQLPPTPEEIANATYYANIAAKKEAARKEVWREINQPNSSERSPEKQKELAEIRKKLRLSNPNATEYQKTSPAYFRAADELYQMISGKIPMDLKRAVFLSENAYYNGTLNYPKYCAQISELVFVCKQILAQNGANIDNKLACNAAIQRLFSDTVNYKDRNGNAARYLPLTYDFSDVWGNDDYSKQCVTKLLKTRTGQCRSLPLLYLILASELNTPAYLALAPNHSYIMFEGGKRLFNFETTCGRLINNDMLLQSGYISPFAIKNKIYLSPLTLNQTICQCLIDLSMSYELKFGADDNLIKWSEEVLAYWPNSVMALMNIHNVGNAYCFNLASQYHFPSQNDYPKYPDLKRKFDAVAELEMQLEDLGYVRIPKETYEKWQKSMDEEKRRREHKQLEAEMANGMNQSTLKSK
jgi:hypothetical protein